MFQPGDVVILICKNYVNKTLADPTKLGMICTIQNAYNSAQQHNNGIYDLYEFPQTAFGIRVAPIHSGIDNKWADVFQEYDVKGQDGRYYKSPDRG